MADDSAAADIQDDIFLSREEEGDPAVAIRERDAKIKELEAEIEEISGTVDEMSDEMNTMIEDINDVRRQALHKPAQHPQAQVQLSISRQRTLVLIR